MLTVERVAMKGSESLRSANQFSASSSPTSVESITSNVKKVRSEREGEVQPVVVVAAAAAAAAAEGLTMENLRKHSTVAVVREEGLENGGPRHRPVGTRRHTTGETKPGGLSRRSSARSMQQRSRLFPLESSDNKTRVSMVASDAPMVARDATGVIVGSPVVGGTGARQQRASQFLNDGSMKASESATAEIKKMRESLLIKREMKRKQRHFLDDDRVLVGNKVSEGHVNFIIAYNMLTGIRVAVSRCSGIMKPLVQKDFHHTKKLAFDYHGNELTPSSQYAFKFKDYCPEVFRELRARFGLDPADYLMSLTSKYILSELNSPGKSGSFFYFSRDYKYIIKTIHHSEHKHLRRVLQDYYHHIKNNPDTLVCQFYGLHRVKMPISFKNKVKSRRIYFIVMNNLFPPHVELNVTFDLKGSTLGRYTKVNKEDEDARPVLKDLNWLEQDMKIRFGPLKGQRFLNQLKKDVEFLTRLNIMDYSLLLGIQETDAAAQNSSEDIHAMIPELSAKHATMYHTSSNGKNGLNSYYPTNTNTSRATAGHFFQRDEGGIRASDSDNNELNIVYYIGIIDCLTNYSLLKKLETFWRGLSHELHAVSAVPPFDYGQRFYKFIEDSVTMGKPRAKLE